MEAYIVTGYRTAVGKANRGGFRFTRPDFLAQKVIQKIMDDMPQIPHDRVDDLIVGNAMPEAEQGLNFARLVSLLSFDTDKISGMTVNRYCASGLETIAIASAKIRSGMADCIIAGGAESMSLIPMGGWRVTPDPKIALEHPDYYWGMGLTAEAVANEYKISREKQDEFSFNSHQKAIKAIEEGAFKDQILPIEVEEMFYNPETEKKESRTYIVDQDEGPRKDTSLEALGRLRPVFDAKGSVTAGNSSQTSDGAAFVMVVSEAFLKEFDLTPIAKLKSFSTVGVPPRIMGIGPIYAIPKALKQAGLTLDDMDLIELNEAFASQSVAIKEALDIPAEKLNIHGGAIALGHPLGCTGAKLTVQMMHALKDRDAKYGLVTMCVGTGQGAAGVIEML